MAHLNYSNVTPGGAAVWGAINASLIQWYTMLRVKAQMDSMMGVELDYTKFEQPFGLDAGTGQLFYDMVTNLTANLGIACATLKDVDKIAGT